MLIIVSGIAAFGLIIVIGITLHTIYTILYPKKLTIKKTPADYEMEFEAFTLKTSDGIDIDTWYVTPPRVQPGGTIVICHNLGSNKAKYLPYAKFLYDEGYSSLLFDFRSHGDSGNDRFIITSALKRRLKDIECVTDFILNKVPSLKSRGLGIMGFSLGTTIGIYFAGRCPYVKAVIVDSGPPFFMGDFCKRLFKRAIKLPLFPFYFFFKIFFILLLDRNYMSYLKESMRMLKGRPVFFIHSSRDTIIPHSHTQAAYNEYAQEPKEYWLVDNAFHLTAFFSATEEYKSRVINFFNKQFDKRGE